MHHNGLISNLDDNYFHDVTVDLHPQILYDNHYKEIAHFQCENTTKYHEMRGTVKAMNEKF
jgi:hypothetical protein